MAYASKKKLSDNSIVPLGSNLFGVCTTASGTAQKDVTMPDFNVLVEGVTIHVYFANANTASNPTLKVGSAEARSVSGEWIANSFASFTYYNGSWIQNDVQEGSVGGVTSVNGQTGDVTITEGLEPLIGTTATVTPQQVMTALGEGRGICIEADTTFALLPLKLKFTDFNRATDDIYSGTAVDIVVSQTIVSDSGNWYVFTLTGGTMQGQTVPWTVSNTAIVPATRTINGNTLDGDITLTYSDVDAVPATRTVNNKALSSDITLDASDVGAVPTTRTVNNKALSSDITLDADDVGALDGNVGGVFFGTCSSGASATAKVVTCTEFGADDLVPGTIIIVSFTATNSGAVASLTMNVNSTGAKPIKYINNGTLGNLSSAGYLKANTEYPFYYDGANWVVVFNVNSTYSALSEADMKAGTATTGRLITAARLKQAVQYHALVKSVNGQTGDVVLTIPTKTSDLTNDSGFITSAPVTSVNGQTGDVTINVPTKTSELTNDSGFLTSAPVTSVNGQTGAVTINVPTATSDLTNDGDGGSPFVTYNGMYAEGYVTADNLAEPAFKAADATSQAVLQQAFGVATDIIVPSNLTSETALIYKLEPRTWFCWMNGTEMEFARMSVSVNTGTSAITLYLRGRTSIATGIAGVDSSWTVTQYATDAEGVAY